MKRLHRLLFSLALVAFVGAASAQTYELSSKWYTADWTAGTWPGKHGLPGVYCLTFPMPDTATELGYGFFNENSIHFTQVRYPDRVAAYVVSSTVPAGRSASEEVSRLLSLERQAEAAYGVSYGISEGISSFGPTVSLRIKNVAPKGRSAPFPLVRPIIRPAREPIETLSVHKLFVRGLDRFEIAAIQLAPEGASDATEAEMNQRLVKLVDQIVQSLQSCTASIPLRTAK
jgi:hypothetical protein